MSDHLPVIRVAAVQAAAVFLDREATIAKVQALVAEASANGARLIVFPESFIPAYPVWLWGSGDGPAEAAFTRLYTNAVDVPGPVTAAIGETARRHAAAIAIGVTERDSTFSRGTLYNTLLVFDESGHLLGKHRKLMPTYRERTVWGQGDGSTLEVHVCAGTRVGGLLCWENLMPLARQALYAQGEQIHLAPTADCGAAWQASLRHIAYEGRIFVVACCQVVHRQTLADDPALANFPADAGWIMRGGSAIVAPDGDCDYLAGPAFDEEVILYADLDLGRVVSARHSFDVAGHYARSDVLELRVHRARQVPIVDIQDRPV